MHTQLRLNRFFLLFIPIFLFSYNKIWDNNSKFIYSLENGDYKVTLSGNSYINFVESKGFSLFLPKYIKEVNLKLIRQNSIGEIDGYLSIHKQINRDKIINVNENNLKYYFTDYKTDYKQLDYLLKGAVIPYKNKTALSFEAYNIPLHISSKLNKNLYFIFYNKNLYKNRLKGILYSFYMIFDKKTIDKIVNKNLTKDKFRNIKSYLKNLHKNLYRKSDIYMKKNEKYIEPKVEKQKPKQVKKIKKLKKVKKVKKRVVFTVPHKKPILYMVEFGYKYQKIKKTELDKKQIERIADKLSNQLIENLNNLETQMKQDLSASFIIKPIELFNKYNNSLSNIISYLENIKWDILNISLPKNTQKCFFNPENIEKKCFVNNSYFQNYIYYSIKKGEIPEKETILGFGNYQVFNDIGKYYFEIGDFNKSESYLLKSYSLSNEKDKKIVSHNLGVLYANRNSKEFISEAIKYLKNSEMEVDYYNLGVYYYLGLGVKEDNKMAQNYFKKAKSIIYAKENLKIMKKYKIGLK